MHYTVPSRRFSEALNLRSTVTNSEKTRERIRAAAQALVAEQGSANLTLEAVAKGAGISKGGLLYHYANKQALLEGMLEDLLAKREALFLSNVANHNSRDQLQSMIEAEFSLTAAERATANAILAAGAEDPQLLDPARDYFKLLFAHIDTASDDTASAMTVVLALQGMQLLETIGLHQLTTAEKNRLKTSLLRLIA